MRTPCRRPLEVRAAPVPFSLASRVDSLAPASLTAVASFHTHRRVAGRAAGAAAESAGPRDHVRGAFSFHLGSLTLAWRCLLPAGCGALSFAHWAAAWASHP